MGEISDAMLVNLVNQANELPMEQDKIRCDFCGHEQTSKTALAAHMRKCEKAQRELAYRRRLKEQDNAIVGNKNPVSGRLRVDT
jgi:hypothetical protein